MGPTFTVSVGGSACRRRTTVAAQDGLDPRKELRARERLGDVVVGADLEAHHPVDLLALGGEDDDRGIDALAAQRAQHLDAAHPRQHDVEEDEVQALRPGDRDGVLAIGGAQRLVALARQVEGERLAQGAVVLDDRILRRTAAVVIG